MSNNKNPSVFNRNRKKFKGVVVSDKMDKTAVVLVESYKQHVLYKKYQKKSKRFKIHDPQNLCKNGDIVQFRECRPLSKEKRFVYLEKTGV